MKSDAFLVNVSRGALVDESALIEALRNHKIAGAALDVFEKEPLPSDSPLWDIDNLLITPHVAGDSDRFIQRAFKLIREQVERFVRGETLINIVTGDY